MITKQSFSPLRPTGAAAALACALLTGCVVNEADDTPDRYTSSQSGAVLTTLPSTAVVRTYDNSDYYVVDDNYYRQTDAGYVNVSRPTGATVTTSSTRTSTSPAYDTNTYSVGTVTRSLPSGYATRQVQGREYYVVNDNNYFTRGRGGYVAVEPPMTTTTTASNGTISSLPSGYVVRPYRGTDYYYANDVYYRRANNGYSVVNSPF